MIAMLLLPFQDAKDEEKSNGEDEKVRGHTVGAFSKCHAHDGSMVLVYMLT